MLSKIISLVFDKAVDEPNFGEMYATLCVDVSKKSGEWSVVRTGRDLDKGGKFFWTDDIMVEKEIVGPFASREECIAAATAEAEPAAQARTQKLRLAELVISGDRFVKILESMDAGPRQYFTVFRSLAEGDGEGEELRERIHGGFEDEQSAMEDGHRATTFKKLLLKKCQEEFYKVCRGAWGWGLAWGLVRLCVCVVPASIQRLTDPSQPLHTHHRRTSTRTGSRRAPPRSPRPPG